MSREGKQELEWPASRVRSTFIEFFKSKQHDFIPSSGVVPFDDPTLLFTNAGMNQFKPIFLGQVDPKNPLAKLKRAANSQKCIRAGGKHNDLEDVGKDTYHHTFFEMLGNWSFGDYFKKEAIGWAWELLTEVYKLNKDRIYVTYFEGNESLGLKPDEEARSIWLQYLPTERVLPFGMKENFWEMGETGPCGPCTEIHFDRIGGRNAAELVNRDDPTVIEIWNNVFIQFNREADKSLKQLPACHVDTGMGLERLVSILQHKMSNYDTDVFMPIFDEISKISNAAPYTGKLRNDDVDKKDMAYRVIADHIRTITFALCDGAAPDKDGRNYVVRRILRRAVRYGVQNLKAPTGFFSKLLDCVVGLMKEAFPEIEKNQSRIRKLIQEEEKSFERTLGKGIALFTTAAEKSASTKIISGEDAFTLYTTFGFPVDLTVIMAEERGYTVDMHVFTKLMKEFSTDVDKDKVDPATVLQAAETSALSEKLKVPVTEDNFKYTSTEVNSTLCAIWTGKEFTETCSDKSTVGLVFDKTSFYAEGGGQIFDVGTATSADGEAQFYISSVFSFAGYVLHVGTLTKGSLKVGGTFHLKIDEVRRKPIMSNHTSTHIVNFALKKTLGDTIDQRGSLVDNEKLRFDFSHGAELSEKELISVEQICQKMIVDNLQVYKRSLDLNTAKSINGVRAVFGEKYPDPVTVVSIGVPIDDLVKDPSNTKWAEFAIEFCGGTHLSQTAEAGSLVIIQEIGTAKGIRRIIAKTGEAAKEVLQKDAEVLNMLENAAKKSGVELNKDITELGKILTGTGVSLTKKFEFERHHQALIKKFLKENAEKEANAVELAKKLAEKGKESGNPVIVVELDLGNDKKAISHVFQEIKTILPDNATLILTKELNKNNDFSLLFIANVADKLSTKLSAGDWVKDSMTLFGGKGGGSAKAAQAVADVKPELSNLDEAVKKAVAYANTKLGGK